MAGLVLIRTTLFVVVWLACIIWVAIDAGRRGVSPVFWPFATLLSGPLGLVTYGIVRELVGKKGAG